MMPEEKLRKADVVTAFCLIALGVIVIIASLQIPFGGSYGGVKNNWYVSPAAFPLILGVLIISSSMNVLIHAAKKGGFNQLFAYFKAKFKLLPQNTEAKRVFLVVLLIAFYVFALFDRLDFYLASFIFLATFMLTFYRPGGVFPRVPHLIMLLLLSAIIPLVTGYIFRHYLLVSLP